MSSPSNAPMDIVDLSVTTIQPQQSHQHHLETILEQTETLYQEQERAELGEKWDPEAMLTGLENFLRQDDPKQAVPDSTNNSTTPTISRLAWTALQVRDHCFCRLAISPPPQQQQEPSSQVATPTPTNTKKNNAKKMSKVSHKHKERLALQQKTRAFFLLDSTAPTDADSIVDPVRAAHVILVVVALSLNDGNNDNNTQRPLHRAVSSAMIAVLAEHQHHGQPESKNYGPKMGVISRMQHNLLLAVLLVEAAKCNESCYLDNKQYAPSSAVDWHIIASLASTVQVNAQNCPSMAQAAASIIQKVLAIPRSNATDQDNDNDDDDLKIHVAAALALAVQIQPWSVMPPQELVEIAMDWELWHAAERVCQSATSYDDSDEVAAAANKAVATLIDRAWEAKRYRPADTYATEFYSISAAARERYVQARFLHACATIAKVVVKGALPIVEVQVDRVDQAVTKVQGESSFQQAAVAFNASEEIRTFTLQQLGERDKIEDVHRLAGIWGIDHSCDEAALQKAAEKRRATYLQWEETCVLQDTPPDLISDPKILLKEFAQLEHVAPGSGPSSNMKVYGFDAEWGEDGAGVDVLQISSFNRVLLLDIPSLSKTSEGVEALAQTVGRVFASPATSTLVGFGCRQDISRLRSSPHSNSKKRNAGRGDHHWLTGVDAVVDLQALITMDDPAMKKLGLSRVTEQYLGKPLDKSEQCSLWRTRPLSIQQRTYAALDAWVCVAVYKKLTSSKLSHVK